ncbi:unnamed protein product [Schistosoma margrebowiei]|uniref:Uncharacterized protein n=1 Tax=Schistosoma margrebowiei TaxID=48269 RepID=A0A183MJZ0_9TREM|nr:unnamed protein product [Schistosoma margrebowiei]
MLNLFFLFISTLFFLKRLMPGPPFAFGAILVLLAILVAIFIPEKQTSPELNHSKIITDTYESTHGANIYGGETRLRRSSPSGQSYRTTADFDQFTCGMGAPNAGDSDKSKLIMSTVEMSKYNLKSGISHSNPIDNNGIWNRLMTGLTDFRNPVYIKQRPNRVYRQSKTRFSTAGIVEPFRRLFIRKTYDGNIGSSGVSGSGGGGFLDHEARLHYSRLPFTVISSSDNSSPKYLDDISKNDLLFSNPLLLNPGESEEAADLSNYRAHHFRRMFITPNTATTTPFNNNNNNKSTITTSSSEFHPSQNYNPTSSLLITSNETGQLNPLGENEEDTFIKHYNSSISPIISPTVSQHAPRLPSNVLNNNPVRRKFSQHFPIGKDGLLSYSPSTQPQLAGACLNCPPSQVQQINPLYQNNDSFGLQKSLVPLALKTIDSVLNSLPESVWTSVNTLNNGLLLGCIYRAPDSSNNGNDLIINAFIHASALNFNAKVIAGDFNYPGINWSTGSCHSYNDEFCAIITMHCLSQWVRTPTRGDSILDLIFSRDVIPLSVKTNPAGYSIHFHFT